jgi:hypothetical protein
MAAITPNLPQFLGNSGGAKTLSVVSTSVAVDVLKQNVYGSPSNGITKLYSQLLAAKFNRSHGADNSAVSSSMSSADNFLSTHDQNSWATLSSSDQNLVLGWQNNLDTFNNGISGPGHCSDDQY